MTKELKSNFTTERAGDYTFINFPKTKSTVGKKEGCYMSLYKKTKKDGSYMISFSSEVGEIIGKKGLNFLRVRKDEITEELYLVFCNNELGEEVKTTRWGEYKKRTICNKNIYLYFANGSLDGRQIHLSKDLSKSDKYATFKLLLLEELNSTNG